MRLITHNMLKCNVKGVTNGFPLKIEVEKSEVQETDFNADFVKNFIPKLEWGALVEAAKATDARFRTGVTWSLDAFYARNAVAGPGDSMISMSVDGYWPSHLEARIRDMQAARILNCEMEAGILLTLAGLFGIRAGAICVVSDKAPWPGPSEIDLDANMGQCIEIATNAMLALAKAEA